MESSENNAGLPLCRELCGYKLDFMSIGMENQDSTGFFFYEELLWGVRGVINEDDGRQIDLALGAYDIFRFQIKHYSFLNLLMIPAMFALWREKRLLWTTLAVMLPNIYVISKLRGEDNVFILTLDVFIAFWIIIGWRVLGKRSLEWIAIMLLLAHSVVFLISEKPFLANSNKIFSDEVRSIGRIIRSSVDPVLFAARLRRSEGLFPERFPERGRRAHSQAADGRSKEARRNADRNAGVRVRPQLPRGRGARGIRRARPGSRHRRDPERVPAGRETASLFESHRIEVTGEGLGGAPHDARTGTGVTPGGPKEDTLI